MVVPVGITNAAAISACVEGTPKAICLGCRGVAYVFMHLVVVYLVALAVERLTFKKMEMIFDDCWDSSDAFAVISA